MSVTENIQNKWVDLQVLVEKSKDLGLKFEKEHVVLTESRPGFECKVSADPRNLSVASVYASWPLEEATFSLLGEVFKIFSEIGERPVQIWYNSGFNNPNYKQEIPEILDHMEKNAEVLDLYGKVACVAEENNSTRFYAGAYGEKQDHAQMVKDARKYLPQFASPRFQAIYDVPMDLWESVSKHLIPTKYVEFAQTAFARWNTARFWAKKPELYISIASLPAELLPRLLDVIDDDYELIEKFRAGTKPQMMLQSGNA